MLRRFYWSNFATKVRILNAQLGPAHPERHQGGSGSLGGFDRVFRGVEGCLGGAGGGLRGMFRGFL